MIHDHPTPETRPTPSTRPATSTHAGLVAAILIRHGADPRWRLWKQPSGMFIAHGPRGDRHVRVGVPGMSDLGGVMLDGSGRLISIEVKTGRDRLRPEQAAWRDLMLRAGALWCEARCVEDVERLLTAGC